MLGGPWSPVPLFFLSLPFLPLFLFPGAGRGIGAALAVELPPERAESGRLVSSSLPFLFPPSLFSPPLYQGG